MNQSAPTRVVTAEEMRALDHAASVEYGIATLVLMENAGRRVALEARRLLRHGHRAVVVCGPGNNGGDGLVAARHLKNRGVHVEVLLLEGSMSGDASTNLEAFRRMGGNLRVLREGESLSAHAGDVVVDALFGLGLSRAPEGLSQSAIEAILVARERGAKVVSVDLPSGLSSDNGRPPGACVEADVTVTLGYIKRGLSVEPGCSLAGRLVVADISIPRSAESRLKGKAVFVLTEGGIRATLPERMPESHKGHYGHVLVVAGSPGKSGAASMTAAGALRGGAGLVTLASREADVRSAQTFMPEMMAHFLRGEGPLGNDDVPGLLAACDGKTVLAIGPGLYRGPETGAAIMRLLAEAKLPAVLDADALNAIAEAREPFPHGAPLILTPHPGEMARLAAVSADEVQNDRIGTARRYADEHKVTVVLKGARTVIADVTGATAINPTGNPGMATAGSGDVLTGLCAALVAQGLTAGSAACAAVFVHGRAGDLASARHGAKGLVATDLLAGITEVWASWGL